jgi:isocitrate/isopropylmalate dehydrogenase
MGQHSVRWPDRREMRPQIDLRELLDLYCGLRPIRLYHESDIPLKGIAAGAIDLLIVRENCEGLFSTPIALMNARAPILVTHSVGSGSTAARGIWRWTRMV